MTNARLYAKIMRHLEKRTGTGLRDFRTLRMCHPQLAEYLETIASAVTGIVDLSNHYMPRRLWDYEGVTT